MFANLILELSYQIVNIKWLRKTSNGLITVQVLKKEMKNTIQCKK